MLSYSSNRLAIAAGSIAFLSLVFFLCDRPENASWYVPRAECEASESEPEVWQWRLPESAQLLSGAKTPRRDSSFLFYDDRLVPLEFPFDEVNAGERLLLGWHRIQGEFLQFKLPTKHSSGPSLASLDSGHLRLEVNGTMSTRRQAAWTLCIIATLWLSVFDRRWSKSLLGDSAVIAIAAVVPVVVIGSLIGSAFYPLPYAWSDTWLGTIVNRFDAILPGLMFLHAIAGWLQNRNSQHSDEQQQTSRFIRYGWLAAVPLVLFSFVRMSSWGPVVTATWSPVETSSPFASSTSYSDAEGYLAGCYHLMSTGRLDQWNQRRPINATLLATRLALSNGNVDLAKWIQAVAMALAMAWVGRELAAIFGWRSAWAALALMLGCGRLFLITTLSEPLGFTLGCLALVGWLRQLHYGCFTSGLAGLGFMTLAQGARPGALFILPAIAIWVALSGMKTFSETRTVAVRLTFSLAITGLVALTFLSVNSMLSRIYGTGENLTGSNFAYTFAGLASGQSWGEVAHEYEDVIASKTNEKEIAQFLYAEGFRLIQEQPRVILREMAKGMVQFGIEVPRFLTSITARSTIDSIGPLLWLQVCALLGLAALAAWRQWKDATASESWFWLLVAAGWMASIPFVFLDGGLRVLIATWPLALAWLATALAVRSSRLESELSQESAIGEFPGNHRTDWPGVPIRWWLIVLSICVVVTAASGPALLRPEMDKAEIDPATNVAAVTSSRRLSFDHRMMGPGVLIIDDSAPVLSPIRVMNRSQWQRAWQRSGIGSASCLLSSVPEVPFQLDQVYQLGSGRTRTLLRPLHRGQEFTPWIRSGEMEVTLCGEGELFGRVIRIFP